MAANGPWRGQGGVRCRASGGVGDQDNIGGIGGHNEGRVGSIGRALAGVIARDDDGSGHEHGPFHHREREHACAHALVVSTIECDCQSRRRWCGELLRSAP
jgi:hypothetical protein